PLGAALSFPGTAERPSPGKGPVRMTVTFIVARRASDEDSIGKSMAVGCGISLYSKILELLFEKEKRTFVLQKARFGKVFSYARAAVLRSRPPLTPAAA